MGSFRVPGPGDHYIVAARWSLARLPFLSFVALALSPCLPFCRKGNFKGEVPRPHLGEPSRLVQALAQRAVLLLRPCQPVSKLDDGLRGHLACLFWQAGRLVEASGVF